MMISYIYFILILSILLAVVLIDLQKEHEILLLSFIPILVLLYGRAKKRETYEWRDPNYLRTGKLVGGTVYASYPNKSPGLGWIL